MKKPGYAMYGVFKKKYEDKTHRQFVGNIHRDAKMLGDIIDDIGIERVGELMDYYCRTAPVPDMTYFIFNYGVIHKELIQHEKDMERREKIRQRTREVMGER